MSQPLRPTIRRIGVNIETRVDALPRKTPGVDFPNGIASVDLEWIEKDILSLAKLTSCETDEDLRALRAEADFLVKLKGWQAEARRPGGA